MLKPSDVTIIIPHLGDSTEQEYAYSKCIDSLRETASDIQTITVKNGELCNHPYDIHINGQGQCMAVNAGVVITNTPWIMITNDDMVYPPGWFDYLQDNSCLCVSPQLVEPRDGAPTFIKYFCGGAGGDFDKNKFFEFNYVHNRTVKPLRTGFNTPFLIKRELWDLIGGYDINYDPWGSNSDSDLLYKIRLAGVQPMQNQNCLVYHFSQTSGTFEAQNQEYWHKNFAYFKEKWGFPRTDERIWEADFEIPDEGRKFRPFWEGHYA